MQSKEVGNIIRKARLEQKITQRQLAGIYHITKSNGDKEKMKDYSKKALKEQYKNRICIGGVYCVKCNENSNRWIRSTTDLQGSKNRFAFSVSINSCPEACMVEDWKLFGASSFSFEILEEIQKKETQTEREFTDDVATLLEIWNNKSNS